MATKLKHQQPAADNAPASTVAPITGGKCSAEGCKKNSAKLNFCDEHYDWFKFGLITKAGKKPTDFDKKFTAYQNHRKQRAA
jgi:hypothetical protein